MTTMPGPRWRGISLTAAAERIGIAPAALHHAAQHGRIAVRARRYRRTRYVTAQELARFACSPACWVVVHPRDIVDPDLRSAALAAWREAGAPTWRSTRDVAAHYHVSRATVGRWRARGWSAGAWHWHGGERQGDWWLIWSGPLPAPPPIPWPTAGRIQPTRRAQGDARRAAVVAAVERRGGPPGRGRAPGFWAAIRDETGASPGYARRIWWQQQRRQSTAAD